MELDIFLKEALVQISRGIQIANEELSPTRKKPDGTELPKLYLLAPGTKQEQGHGIHFDVAITSSTTDEGNGGVKVKLAVVEVDIGGKLKSSEKAVSRIQFSVNVNQWHG